MKKLTYKTIDLFGNETINFIETKKRTGKTLFDDYEAFVEKFKDKKTTDDCYTPDAVYKVVLNFVSDKFDLNGYEIIRPFYQDGDFESIEYSKNCIVIDNPPFSIISKIAKFYIKKGIKFFLFAPHLTLFSAGFECTSIICGSEIVYENGAAVKTSFLSNLFGDVRVMTAPALYNEFEKIKDNNKIKLPKYEYPNNVLTVSKVQKLVENGITLEIKNEHCKHIRVLDDQRKHKKAIFGSGFLLAEKAAAEKEKEIIFVWKLSLKELQIIKSLDCDNCR